jgi:hypothetical protein
MPGVSSDHFNCQVEPGGLKNAAIIDSEGFHHYMEAAGSDWQVMSTVTWKLT